MKPISLSLCFFFLISVLAVHFAPTTFESEGMKLTAEEVFSGTEIVWGMDFISEDEILFTRKSGSVFYYKISQNLLKPVSGAPPTDVHGQGGLMDLKFDPQFSKNNLVYFSHSVKNGKSSWSTRISRAKLDLKKFKLDEMKEIYTASLDSKEGEHFGSRIVFDAAGFLFFSVGERGQRHRAQDLHQGNGKIYRLKSNGEAPSDNPWTKDPKIPKGIWTYGHRNPQGLAFDASGQLWNNEHGPRGGDEINRIERGKNYGWPVVTFGKEYWGPSIGEGTTKSGIEAPAFQWTPSIAPSSLLIYSGKLFKNWKGDFFSGALALTHLNRVVFKNGKFSKQEQLLDNLDERIRNVKESPKGLIYFSTDSGKIFVLNPKQ